MTTRGTVLTVGLFVAAAGPLRGDDAMIPGHLSEAAKATLKKYLAAREKPVKFLPQKYILHSAAGAENFVLDSDAPGEVREYLSAIVPHRDEKAADVYYFRPNPKAGSAGVTVKVTVDLASGAAAGDPTVLVHYSAPLTKEEQAQAVKLAQAEVPAAKALYAAGDVQAAALMETVTATKLADRKPGDRVVTLQLRKKGSKEIVSVTVNVTRETVLKPND